MHFTNTAACISSLLMATASASTPASFEVPGSAPGTAAAPEVDTTTVYETSTYYLTTASTVTSAPAASVPPISAPVNSTAGASTSAGYAPPPEEPVITPSVSLYITAGQTFVPVTLWGANSTVVIFPQNSTTIEIPTGYSVNGTSTVVVTTTASSKTASATTSKDKTSATASASASVSEVPVNGAGKVAGNALLTLGAVAGFMALL